MKKSGLLGRLEQLKAQADAMEDTGIVGLEILDLLLDYINDPDIRTAVDEIPFLEVADDIGNKESQAVPE